MNQKQQVLQWLEDHRCQLQEFLTALIRIPSVSGEEYNVQMAIKNYAEKAGFTVEARAFDENQERPCLLITYPGSGSGKRLMLDAHSDTVPVLPGEKWEHDPFSGDFDGTWIHGGGATDDKWGIATALMAMRALKECGVELSGDVQLLQDTLQGVAMTDLWLREHPPVLEIFAANDGFCTNMADPVVDVVRQAHGQVYGTPANAAPWVAGCDADVICKYAPCVVYGPTGRWAHAANECSNLQDLVDTAKVYAMTAMDFCK